ncbi:MAG: hypothetical protein RLY14_2019 [Planctomycetota bacterium]
MRAHGCAERRQETCAFLSASAKYLANYSFVVAIALVLGLSSGCQILKPKAIVADRYFVTDQQIVETKPVIERGKERPVLDTVGWVIGIPSKIILWDSRADRHYISPETEQVLAQYIEANGLHHVKFRLNQYAPLRDFKRLHTNKSVGWGWRYTFGVVSVLGETFLPGRLFGGDHYNPYTATAHIYSDIPAIALHEAAHAKDFSRRRYPGCYAAVYLLPIVPLMHESIASRDVIAYLDYLGDPKLKKEGFHVLYPAFGTYVGSAAGSIVPAYANPLYIGGVVVGHGVGRWHGFHVADSAVVGAEYSISVPVIQEDSGSVPPQATNNEINGALTK